MENYTGTIGLEVHAELKTRTKLFCGSKNDPNETRPNVNICPVCMGHPGVLPVINREAIKHLIRIGVAVDGEIADYTEFDRKNYFYPDIPKGYQISQYAYPIVKGGKLDGVALTRIHLEEDTASSTHEDTASHVDFNRAGVPLMELVTEPVLRTAEEAGHFARELQLLLRTLGVSDANMEKGEMRIEANISISNDAQLGTKVEVKNLNSFRSVERAIAFEFERQKKLLEKGESVTQETRGWDELKQKTFAQRIKEESHDYRYFPDPDIPRFKLSTLKDVSKEDIKKELPELPWEKRERYQKEYGLTQDMAETLIRAPYAEERFVKELEEGGVTDLSIARSVANYIISEIPNALQNKEGAFGSMPVTALAELAKMKQSGAVSSRGVKEVIAVMIKEGGMPQSIAQERGFLQQSNTEELRVVAQGILKDHPGAVEEYRKGKESSLQFLIGQGMRATKGAANPSTLKEILEEELNSNA